MIMDKEQLENIAEGKYPKEEGTFLWERERTAFISGYNYHKQESEGLREWVSVHDRSTPTPENLDVLVLFESGEIHSYTGNWPMDIATHWIPRSALPSPPHLNKENEI